MKKNKPMSWKRVVLLVLAGASSLVLLVFMVLAGWIGFEIMTTCQSARSTYSGDCVDALISVLKDENQSFAAKNDAIWAIGQLGDKRALTTLQSFYTGQIPDREPWGEVLSQYELKKAIALLEGSPNLPSILWRNFD